VFRSCNGLQESCKHKPMLCHTYCAHHLDTIPGRVLCAAHTSVSTMFTINHTEFSLWRCASLRQCAQLWPCLQFVAQDVFGRPCWRFSCAGSPLSRGVLAPAAICMFTPGSHQHRLLGIFHLCCRQRDLRSVVLYFRHATARGYLFLTHRAE
jgi:hypothetical protein